MQVKGVEYWITDVVCDACGSNIQHYPIYLPMERLTAAEKRKGFMNPPAKFMKVCSDCLPEQAKLFRDTVRSGKLFPLTVWKNGHLTDAVFEMEDGTKQVARTLFPKEE